MSYFLLTINYSQRSQIKKDNLTNTTTYNNITTITGASISDSNNAQGDIKVDIGSYTSGGTTYTLTCPFIFSSNDFGTIPATMPTTDTDFFPGYAGTYQSTVTENSFSGKPGNEIEVILDSSATPPYLWMYPVFRTFMSNDKTIIRAELAFYNESTKAFDNVVSSCVSGTYAQASIDLNPWFYINEMLDSNIPYNHADAPTWAATYKKEWSALCADLKYRTNQVFASFTDPTRAETDAVTIRDALSAFSDNYKESMSNDYSTYEGQYSGNKISYTIP